MQLAVLLVAGLWGVPLVASECTPGTTYRIRCHTCRCSDRGYAMGCTKEECTHTPDCHATQCNRHEDHEEGEHHNHDKCDGNSHSLECHICECGDEGDFLGCAEIDCKHSQACTDIYCGDFSTRLGAGPNRKAHEAESETFQNETHVCYKTACYELLNPGDSAPIGRVSDNSENQPLDRAHRVRANGKGLVSLRISDEGERVKERSLVSRLFDDEGEQVNGTSLVSRHFDDEGVRANGKGLVSLRISDEGERVNERSSVSRLFDDEGEQVNGTSLVSRHFDDEGERVNEKSLVNRNFGDEGVRANGKGLVGLRISDEDLLADRDAMRKAAPHRNVTKA